MSNGNGQEPVAPQTPVQQAQQTAAADPFIATVRAWAGLAKEIGWPALALIVLVFWLWPRANQVVDTHIKNFDSLTTTTAKQADNGTKTIEVLNELKEQGKSDNELLRDIHRTVVRPGVVGAAPRSRQPSPITAHTEVQPDPEE